MVDKGMKEIFDQCQNSMQSHGKLLKILQKHYDKTDFATFWNDFKHLMTYSLIIFQREPAVERTIDFISKFVTYVAPVKSDAVSVDDSSIDEISQNQLLQSMFDFLLKSHSVRDKGIRFRCCQMINKILGNLGEDAQIDDDLYDRIYESMLERLRDKIPVVRMHAVMALARLQDPRDENCPVIKAYLFLVSSDPNYVVRKIVLSHIAPSTKTLQAILERTRDVNDSVRKTAYTVMGEKVHIKALSIANRVRLLQDGLSDRSEIVKSTCASKLLQTWLRTFGGNVLDLLGSLDVENSTETCELALETLLKTASVPEMVERFDLLDDQILIPLEKLNSESSMYWQTLCKYIHSLGHESEEYLDKVLPNCVQFCQYISRYVNTLSGLDDIDAQLEKEFVIQQLLTMTKYMELADQASRRSVENLLHDMLIADHVGHSLVKYIVPRLCEIKDHSESLVLTFAETVSEIREPITTVERGPTQEEKRQNDLKLAGVRVQLNQLKEELDEAVKNQEFDKAAELKASITECETERNCLLEIQEPHVEEIRTEKTDVGTILKCQAIVAEMLEVLPLKSLNPTLQMLIESLILPGIQNEDSRVRNFAVQALGLCCVLSRELVLQYLPLFMQASQIDAEVVRASSLRVIFDMLHMHGLDSIQRSREGEELDTNTSGEGLDMSRRSSVSEKQDDERNSAASKLIVFLCAFLDGESSELRTVAAEGLAKLLLSARVVSSKILSHLILLWYNPTTEDDTHLRHCLGTFFPVYAFSGRCNQEIVEEAFLPTLKTLLNAPSSSPLAEVNIENVTELLVQLTNAKLLLENQSNPDAVKDNVLHDSIAVKVCNEILSNPDTLNLKLWVKILKQIELSENNEVVFKELAVLADELLQVVKEKQCLKSLEKFRDSVKEKVPSVPLEENENQNAMEIENLESTEKEEPDSALPQDPNEADRTSEKTTLNDTALQLEGSLFLQEAKTLRRAQSKTSSGSVTPPKSVSLPSNLDVLNSPVAALFPTKSFEKKTPEASKTKRQISTVTEDDPATDKTANFDQNSDQNNQATAESVISDSPKNKASERSFRRRNRTDSDGTPDKMKSPSKIPRLIKTVSITSPKKNADSPVRGKSEVIRSKKLTPPADEVHKSNSKVSPRKSPRVSGRASSNTNHTPELSNKQQSKDMGKNPIPVVVLSKLKETQDLSTTRQRKHSSDSKSPNRKRRSSITVDSKKSRKSESQDLLSGSEELFDSESPLKGTPLSSRREKISQKAKSPLKFMPSEHKSKSYESHVKKTRNESPTKKSKSISTRNESSATKTKCTPIRNESPGKKSKSVLIRNESPAKKSKSVSVQRESPVKKTKSTPIRNTSPTKKMKLTPVRDEEDVTIKRRVKSATKSGRNSNVSTRLSTRSSFEKLTRGKKKPCVEESQSTELMEIQTSHRKRQSASTKDTPVKPVRQTKTSDSSQEEVSPYKQMRKSLRGTEEAKSTSPRTGEKSSQNKNAVLENSPSSRSSKKRVVSSPALDKTKPNKNTRLSRTMSPSTSQIKKGQGDNSEVLDKTKTGRTNRQKGGQTSDSDSALSPRTRASEKSPLSTKMVPIKAKSTSARASPHTVVKGPSVRGSARKAWAVGSESEMDNSVFDSPVEKRPSTRTSKKVPGPSSKLPTSRSDRDGVCDSPREKRTSVRTAKKVPAQSSKLITSRSVRSTRSTREK